MGKHKPASKHPHKPITKAKAAHKEVKKTVARPTKTKAKKEPVAKKPAKPSAPEKAKKPEKSAHAPKPKAAEPAPAKAKTAAHKPEAPAPAVAHETDKPSPRLTPDELRKQLMAKAKSRTKTQRASAFTLDDVRGELARSSTTRPATTTKTPKADAAAAPKPAAHPAAHVHAPKAAPKIEQRHFGAASLADILGYNPVKDEKPEDEEASIDKKFIRYYKLLVELRDHVKSGLETHAEETLKRSSRDDSGDLSGYGQHMADAGTDNFDRDFALSLVSNEQEALFEIEEAIKRIKNGTYGICELTGKPISKDRLLAVPFARFSVESQAEIEKTKRRSSSRGGVFGEVGAEDGSRLVEDDSE
ncbi:MAG: TraR/DksA C4-type zinc finger protein [Opitutaceae bacterium]|nr:TraR/DksA C4-type zinc finger protein [Opitutaceae bacterium]